jgi:Bacterial SH3 domain
MKRLLQLLLVCLLWATTATAQTAAVKRNVNLRSDSSTDSDIIESLKPGDQLQLVSASKTNGFYQVTAADGQKGWVWARNIKILEATPTATPAPAPNPRTAAPASSQAPASDLFSQLMNARKTPMPQPLIVDGTQVCGPTGDATDPTAIALNTNKNRTDIPGDSDYVDIGWSDLENLPSDRVDDFVSAPVRVIGYLSHKINVENSGRGESTNCHKTADNEVDWHIYLTEESNQPISKAIIVETTPRTRPLHTWTTSMLGALVNSENQVRVSGWLMYDSEHINVIGTQRATVWEVHPITKIEIQSNGQWVDIENQP